MSSVRFRFSFHQGPLQVKTSGSISGIVEGVAVSYADKTFDRVKTIVGDRLQGDVMAEFSQMATVFKQFVIGIGQGNTGPRGSLSPTHDWSEAMRASGQARSVRANSGVSWMPRTARYMSWKARRYNGNTAWFRNEGATIGPALGSAKNWVSFFGPIKVGIQRVHGRAGPSIGRVTRRSPYQAGKYVKFRSEEDSHIRESVANISISALTYITPGMLPALASGNLGALAADGRKTGLLGLLPPAVAHRLGGRQAKYRHTIEPFLSYFLTRAVPNALFLRIEKGLGATLTTNRNRALSR